MVETTPSDANTIRHKEHDLVSQTFERALAQRCPPAGKVDLLAVALWVLTACTPQPSIDALLTPAIEANVLDER